MSKLLDRNEFTNYIFIRMFRLKKIGIIITTKNKENYWISKIVEETRYHNPIATIRKQMNKYFNIITITNIKINKYLDIVFMNSGNYKENDLHMLLLDFSDKTDLKRPHKYITLLTSVFITRGEI